MQLAASGGGRRQAAAAAAEDRRCSLQLPPERLSACGGQSGGWLQAAGTDMPAAAAASAVEPRCSGHTEPAAAPRRLPVRPAAGSGLRQAPACLPQPLAAGDPRLRLLPVARCESGRRGSLMAIIMMNH